MELIYVILAAIAALAPFGIIQFYVGVFPTRVGRISEMGHVAEKRGGPLSWGPGQAGIPVRVECEDGSIVDAEVGYCMIHMEHLGVGSRVGVTKLGRRWIAMPLWLPWLTDRVKR